MNHDQILRPHTHPFSFTYYTLTPHTLKSALLRRSLYYEDPLEGP